MSVGAWYSYVSGGLLVRFDGGSRHQGSRFARAAVEDLARQHRRVDASTHDLRIDSDMTYLDPRGHLLFRGRDAVHLATTSSFEHVAELLWQSSDLAWSERDDQHGTQTVDDLIPAERVTDRIRAAVLRSGAHDCPSAPAHVRFPAAGVTALSAAIGAVLGSADHGPISDRLASAFFVEPTEPQRRLINAALIMLADHELATSTVAARAAAGVGAAPYLVVLAGLSALCGPKHGQASIRALHDFNEPTSSDRLPAGFGHTVYTGPDPRAELLFELLRADQPETTDRFDDYALNVQRDTGLLPNVGLALAAICLAYGLPENAGEVIFTIARITGFIAHGMQEHSEQLRFRPRAIYTGPLV